MTTATLTTPAPAAPVVPDDDPVSTAGVLPVLPAVADQISSAVTTQVPAYHAAPVSVQDGTRWLIDRAVRSVACLASAATTIPDRIPGEAAVLFRWAGTVEAEAGRTRDDLLAAHEVAARTLARELESGPHRESLASSTPGPAQVILPGYVVHLAGLAVAGFEDHVACTEGQDSARSRLLQVLLEQYGVSPRTLGKLSSAAGLPLPARAAVAEIHDAGLRDVGALRAVVRQALGPHTIAGTLLGQHLVVLDDETDVGALAAALRAHSPSTWISLGSTGPLEQLPDSARLAHWLARRRADGHLGRAGDPVVRAEEHLPALLAGSDATVTDALASHRLHPLSELGPQRRLTYAELASALLELGDRHGHAPGVLDVPRSTLHNRIKRVEELFGEDWNNREARVEIMLALRAVLPRWRAEAAYAAEHPRAETRARNRSRGRGSGTHVPDSARSYSDPP